MLFSIIIPTYNYAKWLAYALDSVLEQDDNGYEIIVVDDGSTDDTAAVVAHYCTTHNNRIRYFYQANQGVSVARNSGAAHAKGEYLLFLDADDRLLPRALNKFRVLLEEAGSVDFAFGGCLAVSAGGSMRKYTTRYFSEDHGENFKRYLRGYLCCIPSACMFHRELFNRIKWPEKIHHCEDVVVFGQVFATSRCSLISEPVVAYYIHADSLVSNVERLFLTGLQAVDVIFDPKILPAHLMSMRNEFLSRLCRRQFRLFYKAGHYREAKRRYEQAVHASSQSLLDISCLRKYLRIIFKLVR
jgi:glycosyltransferase involved in cell wall biosynthesis